MQENGNTLNKLCVWFGDFEEGTFRGSSGHWMEQSSWDMISMLNWVFKASNKKAIFSCVDCFYWSPGVWYYIDISIWGAGYHTLFEDFLLSNVLTLLSQKGLTDPGTDETIRQHVTYPLSITPYKRARSTLSLPAILSLQFWFPCPLRDGKAQWAPPCSRHAPSLPIEGHCLPE